MDFKKLYNSLAQIAKSRNEKLPFMEGNPKVMGGYGRPDPDWALMAIHTGVKEGVISSQQAAILRKEYEPHARFEHRDDEVHVRAHTREGKQVAAHTRSAPAGQSSSTTPAATPPIVAQRPMPQIRNDWPQADKKQPRIRPLSAAGDIAEEGMQVAQNMKHVLDEIIGNTSNQLEAAKGLYDNMHQHLQEVPLEAQEVLDGYSTNLQREVVWEVQSGSLPSDINRKKTTFKVLEDNEFESIPPQSRSMSYVRKSDYQKLMKILRK